MTPPAVALEGCGGMLEQAGNELSRLQRQARGQVHTALSEADRELQARAKRIEELEAALDPLAYPCAHGEDYREDAFEGPGLEAEIDCCVRITFADVKRARDLLANKVAP